MPSKAIDIPDGLRLPDLWRNISKQEGPFEQFIICLGVVGLGILVLFGFSDSLSCDLIGAS